MTRRPAANSHRPAAPLHWGQGGGWIEAVVGSMFSGKTQELIRRLRLATIARQKVQVFNSALDTRYAKDHIVSHDLSKIPSQAASKARDILGLVEPDTLVVGIDEVQFFDETVVEVCEELANQGRRVIVAGLDQDYRGAPFAVTCRLMGIAEFVTKNLAICAVCGSPANRSQRLSVSKKVIEVGSAGKYEARCRRCFKR
jgi:thymidine kinase